MAACPNCGTENTDEKKFCTRCGKPLAHAEALEPAVPADIPAEELPPLLRPKSRPANAATAETAPPDFDIKTDGARITAPEPPPRMHEPDAEFDDEEPEKPSLLERKPWLLHVTCLGSVGLILFFFASILMVRIPQKLKERREIMGSQGFIKKIPDAAGDTCFIKASRTVGEVLVQIREGRNLEPLKPGDCIPAGGGVYTRDDARVQLRFDKIDTDVFLNSNTGANFNLMGMKLIVTLNRGEIWLQANRPMAAQFVLSSSISDAEGPGKFHVITRDQQSYFTSSSGKMKIGLPGRSFNIEDGQQLAFVPGKSPEVQDIDLDAFHNWVNAWKNDWTAPQKAKTPQKGAGQKTQTQQPGSPPSPPGQPAEKPVDHKKLIEQTVRGESKYAKLPKYIAVEVIRFTDRWAIAVLRDTRSDADLKDDYQPTTPLLLTNKDGHWIFLEAFEDYNMELYNLWVRKYGFTKKDATSLKLEY